MIGNVTRCMTDSAIHSGKPTLFVIIQGNADDGARAILREREMLCYETMDEGLRVLESWMKVRDFGALSAQIARPEDLLGGVVDNLLPLHPTEVEVKTLVEAYGVPIVRDCVATTANDAVDAAQQMGFPVVLKGISRSLIHKSDAGAVHLDLDSSEEVAAAWHAIHSAVTEPLEGCLVCEMEAGEAEMIVGTINDPEFGPMVLFGLGGLVAEIIDDVKVTPAPVSAARVGELLRELKLWPVLDGARGCDPLDIEAVCDIVSRLSWLAVDAKHRLQELDLNPILVKRKGEGAVAVDARATVVP